MKKDKLLNPAICSEVAALGHTEYLCIADCGLPIPSGVKTIDVSVMAGVPGFLEVLEAVASELVVESAIIASELDSGNKKLASQVHNMLPGIEIEVINHENFKKLLPSAKCIIRTGEVSPYANIALVGGVNF